MRELTRSARLALVRQALEAAFRDFLDSDGDEIYWTDMEAADLEGQLDEHGLAIVSVTRKMTDGSPCWCVSEDRPHDGWQHSPACQRVRAAAGWPA